MEEWRMVVGYEGLYEVSSFGNIRNVRTGKVLKLKHTRQGYIQIMLYKDGTRKTYSVHRLVAIAFIPNEENKREVNHIDENKANNHVSNLEWVTPKENINHGTCIERRAKACRKCKE